jgi:hypothetical protein
MAFKFEGVGAGVGTIRALVRSFTCKEQNSKHLQSRDAGEKVTFAQINRPKTLLKQRSRSACNFLQIIVLLIFFQC